MINLKSRIERACWRLFCITPVGKKILAYMNTTDRRVLELRMELLKFHRPDLTAEADYMLQNGRCKYPYKQFDNIDQVKIKIDVTNNLPYLLHKGKRLYFPRFRSKKWCLKYYTGLVEREAILGGHYMEKHPHQYQSEHCKIENGDILVDVGCAEALLALDNIEKVSKIYLFECNSRWYAPLRATFKDYQDKVHIVCKRVGAEDTKDTVTLESSLKKETGKKLFIKMDIEGAEVAVLQGNKQFLSNHKNVKLAVCTYHRQSDADDIYALFDEMGYKSEFSDGYMYLSRYDKNDCFPYFRKGVLRGWK